MEEFFKKYPLKFNDLTAIKMIHKKVEDAEKKCKDKNPEYMKDLAIANDMLESFFEEKNIDPSAIIM